MLFRIYTTVQTRNTLDAISDLCRNWNTKYIQKKCFEQFSWNFYCLKRLHVGAGIDGVDGDVANWSKLGRRHILHTKNPSHIKTIKIFSNLCFSFLFCYVFFKWVCYFLITLYLLKNIGNLSYMEYTISSLSLFGFQQGRAPEWVAWVKQEKWTTYLKSNKKKSEKSKVPGSDIP